MKAMDTASLLLLFKLRTNQLCLCPSVLPLGEWVVRAPTRLWEVQGLDPPTQPRVDSQRGQTQWETRMSTMLSQDRTLYWASSLELQDTSDIHNHCWFYISRPSARFWNMAQQSGHHIILATLTRLIESNFASSVI